MIMSQYIRSPFYNATPLIRTDFRCTESVKYNVLLNYPPQERQSLL